MSILRVQFMKFLIVGCINTLFGYLAFALFIFWGFHYAISSLLATILGVLFNFKTTGAFVFQNKDNSRLLHFFCVYGVWYICNVVSLKILGSLGIEMYLAGAIVLFPLAIVSFVLNKFFVFEPKGKI